MYCNTPSPDDNPPALISHAEDFVPVALTSRGIDADGQFLYVLILLLNRASGGIAPDLLILITKWPKRRHALACAQLIDCSLIVRRPDGLWCECLLSDDGVNQ